MTGVTSQRHTSQSAVLESPETFIRVSWPSPAPASYMEKNKLSRGSDHKEKSSSWEEAGSVRIDCCTWTWPLRNKILPAGRIVFHIFQHKQLGRGLRRKRKASHGWSLAKHKTHALSQRIPTSPQWGEWDYPHFTAARTEAQRGGATCTRLLWVGLYPQKRCWRPNLRYPWTWPCLEKGLCRCN